MKTVGYKAMNEDMTYRGYQFEVGKIYTINNDKPLELCTDSGFHFCLILEDVFKYYDFDNCRIFEVETDSEVVEGINKSITKVITIKRELTQEDFSNYQFKDNQYNVYFKNYTDEELLKFKNDFMTTRKAVASKMRNLDLMFNTFKDDESWMVRREVVNKMENIF